MPQEFCRPTNDPCKVRLFHICHLDNLPSILQAQALFPLNVLIEDGKTHRSIARAQLQKERDETVVPCVPQGNLHDYVPFYFAARSPMLGAISRADLAVQDEIVTLVSAVGSILKTNHQCVFTDGHPLTRLSRFCDDLNQLPGSLDWETLQSVYWNKTSAFPDRMRKRQAEFLVHGAVPWSAINGVAVRTSGAKLRVQSLLANSPHQPTIAVRPEWYFDF